MRKKKIKRFLKVCPKKMLLILLFASLMNFQTLWAAEMLVPSGRTVGVVMDTNGLLVLGTGSVNGENAPCSGILQAGDLLLEAEGKKLENKEVFKEIVENSAGGPVHLRFIRSGREREVSIRPVFSQMDQTYRIGAWIRDSIQGIGTVTYYDPSTKTFGALGHGVYDVDTGKLMDIRNGTLAEVELTEIVRGQEGSAGELTGTVEQKKKMGMIRKNTGRGVFGSAEKVFDGEAFPIAEREEIQKGKAVIFSDLAGGDAVAYEVVIEDIRKTGGREGKDMSIRITDERLLKLTGGIVQGMSGSPIIQDGKLVGAVTHVLVNDPTRGYGIFIENMLEAAG